ncbi:hypothetical protein FXO37_12910 [Capsicum annuum]|nr:hypothetical protein FXO37_12910 [Capsicum annuum]
MGTFETLGLKQVVKTTEETLTVDSDHATFKLLSESNFAPYRETSREFKLPTGETTTSVFLPQQSFQIKKDNKVVHFTVFAKLIDNDTAVITAQNVNTMLKQHNYANYYISILGEQIISLHEKIDKVRSDLKRIELSNTKQLDLKLKDFEVLASPTIQPPPEIKDVKLSSDLDNIKKLLEEKFRGLKINSIHDENFAGDNGGHVTPVEINKISDKFSRKPTQKMFYYPRPTP